MIEKYSEDFLVNGYTMIPEIFEQESIDLATTYYRIKFNIIQDYVVSTSRKTLNCPDADIVGPLNEQYYADPLSESFLNHLTGTYRELTGKKLIPTYSFCRYYTKGHWLGKHSDRPSCQYSCTVPIAGDLKEPWGMYCNGEEVFANVNDALFYKGCEVEHYRDVLLQDGYQVQLHLHYVDSEDEAYKIWQFDTRPDIGYPEQSRSV